LDHFNKVFMECENDIKVFQKSTERQRVYMFLGVLMTGLIRCVEKCSRRIPHLAFRLLMHMFVVKPIGRKQ
jgi:hypothetical protein